MLITFGNHTVTSTIQLKVLGMYIAVFSGMWGYSSFGLVSDLQVRRRLPMPKGLLPIIGALLLALFLAGGMIWGLTMGIWEWIPPERSGFAARLLLWAVGTAGALTAFGGLIQSRLSDYRCEHCISWDLRYLLNVL